MQPHADQMSAMAKSVTEALRLADVDGSEMVDMALDTAGSSVVAVDEQLQPLDEYYVWCDHRAHNEALRITTKAHALQLEAIEWCGSSVYSQEWGWAKLRHWLRHATEEKRARLGDILPELCSIAEEGRRN